MYENSLKLKNSMKTNGISTPYKKIQFLKGFPSNHVFYVHMLDPPWHLPVCIHQRKTPP